MPRIKKAKSTPMDSLQFKHIPINGSFVIGCGLYAKVSKTMAICIRLGEKYSFRQTDNVSLLKTHRYSSFNQGSCQGSYDRKRMNSYAAELIKRHNEA